MRISSDECEPYEFDTQPTTHWLRSSTSCRRPTHKPRKKKTDGAKGVPLDYIGVPLERLACKSSFYLSGL